MDQPLIYAQHKEKKKANNTTQYNNTNTIIAKPPVELRQINLIKQSSEVISVPFVYVPPTEA